MMLSSGSYTMKNPYNTVPRRDNSGDSSSDSSSLATILHSLVSVTSNGVPQSYSTQQWTHLQSALQAHSSEWDLTSAKTFLEWVMQQVERKGHDEHAARSLNLLCVLLQHGDWHLSLIYTISCPLKGQESPFQFLAKCARDSSRLHVQSTACACLAALWRALSHFDSLMAGNAVSSITYKDTHAWWITSLEDGLSNLNPKSVYWNIVFEWSLGQWLRAETDMEKSNDRRSDHDGEYIEKETLKYAASILLTQFLQDDSTSTWLHSMSEAQWWTLTERLVEQSQRLLDPNMPMTSFARLSLASLHLLSVMERKAGREMPSAHGKLLDGPGGLVVVMMQSVFNVTNDGVPRWAADGTEHILPILREWSRGGSLMNFWEMDARAELARTFAKDILERIRDRGVVKHSRLSSFLWLLRETPALCRNVIQEISQIHHWTSFVGLFVSLLLNDKICDSLTTASVLHQIACLHPNRKLDGHDPQHNGDVIVQKLVAKASSIMDRREDNPLLLLLLDVLGTLCGVIPEPRSSVGSFVEGLFGIMSPRDQQQQIAWNTTVTDAVGMDSTMDSAESTPPAHNLSKLDESRILPDEIDETIEVEAVYGIKPCLRVSAATLLVTFLKVGGDTENRDFQTRASKMLSEFVASEDMIVPPNAREKVSDSATLRRASLMRCFATMQRESYFFDTFACLESSMRTAFESSFSETARLQNRIDWLEQREKQISGENSRLESQLRAQNATSKRERDILHRKLVHESRQTMQAEIAQRADIQREADGLRVKAKELQDQLCTAEAENRVLRENNESLSSQLCEKTELSQELQKEVAKLTNERDRYSERVSVLSKEMETANEAISGYMQREKQYRDQIVQNEKDLEGLEASRAEMHANLESLFGDMVCLAQAYELKEKEVSSGQESKEVTIEKLEKDLEKERQRRKELEDKYRQVEYENEALSRKYARAREKLEEERKQKSQAHASQASARRGDGSKSYIQQLQLTTSRSSTHSRSRDGKENELRTNRSSKIR